MARNGHETLVNTKFRLQNLMKRRQFRRLGHGRKILKLANIYINLINNLFKCTTTAKRSIIDNR